VVVGHGSDRVREAFSGFDVVGESGATAWARGTRSYAPKKRLQNFTGDIVILSADVPLIQGRDAAPFAGASSA
jgi:bifunctional N-acetylglucosamine-1-phosphate-uridyltransferase/glucosamine-1-phosphate-acetyltransferase GlmU-like protein